MANPPTKNNLESSHFLNTSSAVQERLTKCLRLDAFNIRPFSQPSEAIQAIKEGLNRVQPRIPGMKQITSDGQNNFGVQTREAVLAYKSFNGIIRAGQNLDPIVGRGTLARLDTELKNMGPQVFPPPPVLEFGSSRWRFTFFCNKGIFGKGLYNMFIGSTELQDSGNFDIDELAANGDIRTGFKGTGQGTFSTAKKMNVKEFESADCIISITRLSRTLTGSVRIQKLSGTNLLDVPVTLPKFSDDTLSIDNGTMIVRGRFGKKR